MKKRIYIKESLVIKLIYLVAILLLVYTVHIGIELQNRIYKVNERLDKIENELNEANYQLGIIMFTQPFDHNQPTKK